MWPDAAAEICTIVYSDGKGGYMRHLVALGGNESERAPLASTFPKNATVSRGLAAADPRGPDVLFLPFSFILHPQCRHHVDVW